MDRLSESPLGLFIAFQNENAGKSIFDKWIQKFGKRIKKTALKLQ